MFSSQWYPSHYQNPTVMPEGEDGCLETTKIPKASSRLRKCEFGGVWNHTSSQGIWAIYN